MDWSWAEQCALPHPLHLFSDLVSLAILTFQSVALKLVALGSLLIASTPVPVCVLNRIMGMNSSMQLYNL